MGTVEKSIIWEGGGLCTHLDGGKAVAMCGTITTNMPVDDFILEEKPQGRKEGDGGWAVTCVKHGTFYLASQGVVLGCLYPISSLPKLPSHQALYIYLSSRLSSPKLSQNRNLSFLSDSLSCRPCRCLLFPATHLLTRMTNTL